MLIQGELQLPKSATIRDTTVVYPMREVYKHCHYTSCWIVIDNFVYDVTDFIRMHPGGQEIIMEHAGRDATTAFRATGHSSHAAQLLLKYKIGQLHPEDCIYT